MSGALPENWADRSAAAIREIQHKAENIASRKASQNTLGIFAELLPELIGGSADLTGSNLTKWPGSRDLSRTDRDATYVFYGVREFAMAAINNGIAVHGGLIPYGGTFLTFSDYARNGVRMAALMKLRNIFVYTHDSIGLGEDGPTHQAVEHAASLRLIPSMSLWRPCDAVESAVAWKAARERADGPTALLFTRQSVAHQPRSAEQLDNVARGGYILLDGGEDPDAVVIATGSEISLAVEAAATLKERGVNVRVVSMPSTDVFDGQDCAYKESVLPAAIKARVAVEAGVTDVWYKYIGLEGRAVGIDSFGESAPAPAVFEHFGFTAAKVVDAIEQAIGGTTVD